MSDATARRYTGGCLCGAITYAVDGPPRIVAQCHCRQCRKGSGSGQSVGAMFRADQLSMAGALAKFDYRASTGSLVTNGFCAACGSSIAGWNTGSPEHVTIAMGSLDADAELEIEVIIHAGERQSWDPAAPGTPAFESQPRWNPDDDA